MVLEGLDLDGAPRDALDDARCTADSDHVADLKRLVGVERDAREEVAERVLKREAEDDAEERRARQQRAEREVPKWST